MRITDGAISMGDEFGAVQSGLLSLTRRSESCNLSILSRSASVGHRPSLAVPAASTPRYARRPNDLLLPVAV